MTTSNATSEQSSFPPEQGKWCYLTALEIENVRCFGPRQTLALTLPDSPDTPARWTVILGENGTGKTTLLQAAVLMSPRDISGLGDPSYRFVGPRFSKVGQASWKETVFKDHSKDVKLGSKLLHRGSDEKTKIMPFLVTYPMRGSFYFKPGEFPKEQAPADVHVFAYGSSRKINEIRTSSEYVADEGYETLFSETVGLTDPAELIAQTYLVSTLGDGEEIEQRERAQQKLARLKEALIEVLPDVESISIEVQKSRPVVLFETAYGKVRSSQLSSGYRAMAAWVGDLVGRLFDAYPDSEQPLHQPAVVLVDEFDLHLHPTWQRESVQFLTERFPAVQFIVTAHSPLVVQSAPDVNIALLRREEDHVVIDNDPGNVSKWRVDQILTSELFGLSSARSESVQRLLDERTDILSKSTISDEAHARLQELEDQLGDVPYADSPTKIRAEQMLDDLTRELKERLGSD